MQDYSENIRIAQAIDHYLSSKANSFLSISVASGTIASTQISNVPLFYTVVNDQLMFNWVFLFQVIGAAYVSMQIIFMLYKFLKWAKEVYDDARN